MVDALSERMLSQMSPVLLIVVYVKFNLHSFPCSEAMQQTCAHEQEMRGVEYRLEKGRRMYTWVDRDFKR